MRRPPFQVNPLALSVALLLAAPAAAVAQDTPLTTNSSVVISNPVVVISGAGVVQTNNVGNVTELSGVVSGAGQLVKQGDGTLSLTNNNTYQSTLIEQGTLSIKRASSLGDGNVTITEGSTLATQTSTTITNKINLTPETPVDNPLTTAATISTVGKENITQITSSIGGSSGLIKSGEGTLSLTADNAYMGNTVIQQGTLAISREGSLGAGANVTINNGTTLQTNKDVTISKGVILDSLSTIDTHGNNSKVTGNISGSGALVKSGDGSLTLDTKVTALDGTVSYRGNDYGGGTAITGGLLIVNDDKDLGKANTNVVITGGTLQIANDITLERNIITVSPSGGSISTAGHNVELKGAIVNQTGYIGHLVKSGAGKLTLTSDQSNYNFGVGTDGEGKEVAMIGNTVINGGTLSVAKDEFLGIKQKQFSENGFTQAEWDRGNLLIDGGILETTAGFVTKRTINIGAAGATIDVAGAANITSLQGLITGKGDLIKEGDGTLSVHLQSSEYAIEDKTIGANYKENAYGKTIIKAGVLEVGTVEHDLAVSSVELAGGNLKITGVSTLGSLSLTGSGGAIDTSGSTVTIANISGAATAAELKKKGSGTLVLNGINSYAGDTTISEGKVQISGKSALGADASKLILDGGALQVIAATKLVKDTTITTNNGTIDTTSQNVTLEGKISGVGQLIKSGSGTLTLASGANSGDNTFEGGVRIKEGTLEVSKDSALGKDGGNVVIDGATLAITGTGDNTLERSITLTEKGGTVSVAAGGKATLTGELQLDKDVVAADLTKAGAGELALTKDNTTGKFKGNTIIKEGTLGVTSENNLAQGKLFLDGGNLRTNADVLTFSKDIILNSQGGIDTNSHDSKVQSIIQGDGSFVKSGEGTLTLEGVNTYAGGTLIEGTGTVAAGHKASVLAVTNHANLGLNNTNITLDKEGELKLLASLDIGAADGRALVVGSGNGSLDTNGHDSTISSAITGTGKLTKKGEGKLTLTANNLLTGGVVNNTQTGGITVEQGTLSISNDNNLGSVSAVLTLKTDAAATAATTLEVTNNVSLNHQIVLAGGDVTLAQGANKVTAGQVISGSGSITKTGSGDLTLDAANTYTGGTHINNGSVTLSKDASSLGSGVVTWADGTTLNTLANVSVANKTALGGSVTVNTADKSNATFVSTAVISDASNTVGILKKEGKGTLVLDSTNTYSGGTQINNGAVAVSQDAALGKGAVALSAIATLEATANVTLANELTLATGATVETSANLTLANQVTLNGNGNATFNARQNSSAIVLEKKVTGTGGMTKDGEGSITLKSANDYVGGTTVNKGTLVVAAKDALSKGAVTLLGGLDSTGKATTTLETANVDLANAINLTGAKTDKVNLSVATGNSTMSGVISGAASLVKRGDGVLKLTGDNSVAYTGDTIIEGGALAISSGKNLGANGTNVTLQGGDLQLENDIQINGGSITTVANSSGGINTNGHNSTMSSTVKGAGTFVKKGDGTLTLEADNSALIGGVRVEKGTLAISQDASLGKSDAKLTLAGGILNVTKDVTLNRDVSINTTASTIHTNANVNLAGLVSGDAQLILDGGTFKLTHDNSYAGGTKVVNSLLTINNTKNLGAEAGVLTLENGTLQTTGDLATSRQVVLSGALNAIESDIHKVTLTGEISGSGSLFKSGSGDLILSHQNTYTGDTTINGGKVILDGNNASFGSGAGTVTFANATMLETSSNVTVSNAIQLEGQTTVNAATANSSLMIANAITGSTGSLIKTGAGTLKLDVANNYASGTTINAGTVVLGQQASLGSGAVTLKAGTTLETAANLDNTIQLTGDGNSNTTTDAVNLVVAQGQSSVFSKAVTGDAGLAKAGTGTLKLDAANSYTGGTTISAGTVALSSKASLGSGAVILKAGTTLDTAANLTNAIQLVGDQNASTKNDLVRLTVAQANSSTLSGIVTGDAGLIKDGIGQLTLTGDNMAYTGDVHIDAGKVSISNSHALGSSNAVSFATNTTLETTNSVTLENNILLSGNTTLNSKNHDSTFKTGTISGTGSLTKQGTGKLTLEGDNTAYTGNMSITEGTLAINNNHALGGNNTVTFASGTTLETNQTAVVSLANTTIQLSGNTTFNNADTSSLTVSNAITGTGGSGLTKAGTGTLTLSGANSYTGNTSITGGKVVLGTNAATLGANTAAVTLADATTLETSANAIVANAVTLSGGQATLSAVSANSSLTMSNAVNGNGGLIKAGAGTLTLNTANTYTGNTSITGGKVVLGTNASTLGASTAVVTLADATALETSANATITNAIVLSGGQSTVNTTSLGSSLTINQAITGAGGLIKAGTGTLTLSGANTYTGDTSISSGKVVLATNTASLGAANTGTVTLANATILETSAKATIANTVQLNGQATVNAAMLNSSLTMANAIVGTGGIVKIGEGNLVLSEANTYSGNTQINRGKVIVGNSQSLGGGNASFDGGTALVTSAAVTLANNMQLGGSVTVDTDANNSALTGVVSGTGSLAKIGSGSLTLSRANTYTGDTLINAGKVIVSDNSALGVNNNAVFQTGTTLETSGAVTLANQVQLAGNTTISNTSNVGLDGVVSGIGMLTKTGSGDLTLTKANTYKGGTTINQGTVIVGNAASFGDVAGSVTLNSGTTLKSSTNVAIANSLVFTGSGQRTLNTDTSTLEIVKAITGTGGFIKAGTGTLKLNAENTYVGDTEVNAGKIILGSNAASFGNGNVSFGGATTLETSANATVTNAVKLNGQTTFNTLSNGSLVMSNVISSTASDVGGLTKDGVGSLTLSNANTYTAGTTVNAGKVIVGHSTALGSGLVTFKSGTELTTTESATSVANSLKLDGSLMLHNLANSALTGDISGTGSLTKDGAGTLRLEHANTSYNGSITISEGGLVVNNNSALGAGQLTLATGTTLETANAVTLANRIQLAGDATLNSSTNESVLAGQITGVGKLTKTGAGSITLNESNSYAGGTSIKAGTVVVKNDKSLGAKQAEFANNTTLKIDATSAITLTNDINLTDSVTVNGATHGVLSGVVSGAGSLTKDGSGSLTLSGVNTYTGTTTVNAGSVVINTTKSLGAGAVTLANGTTLATAANTSIANKVTLSGGQATLGTTSANSGLTMTSTIEGDGGLIKVGAGTLTLNTANTYKGNTAIAEGKVVLGTNAASLGSSTAVVTLADATTLETSANATVANAVVLSSGQSTVNTTSTGSSLTISQAITGSGGLIKVGAGTLTLNTANTYKGDTSITGGKVVLATNTASLGSGVVKLANATILETSSNVAIANAIQLDGQATVNTALNASALALSNAITGTGGLSKTGLGTLTLGGANNYKGNTTINAGTVIVGNNLALGEGSVAFTDNTMLKTSAAISLANAITLNGKTMVDTQTNDSRLTGTLTGSGALTKVGTGSLALDANNASYTGSININAGKLVINDSKALGGGEVNFAAGTELNTSKSIVINNQMTLAGNTTVNNTDALEIKTIKGAGGLTKSGLGSLTLSGTNFYTGGTTINAGKLTVGGSASLGTGAVSFGDNTTLETLKAITLANKIDLTGNTTLNSDYEGSELNGVVLNGVMSGGKAGKLIKVGKGSLTLAGVNTYAGGTAIKAGKVIIGQNSALGTGGVTFENNTALDIVAEASTVVTLDNMLTLNGTTTLTNASNVTEFKGVVSGSGGLIKQGKGILTLTEANTYAGGTTIQAGLVAIKQDSNLGTGLLTLNGGGLQFAKDSAPNFARNIAVGVNSGSIDTQANSINASGKISGTGTLTKLGVGSLTLSGDNTAYTGSLSIDAGTLAVAEQKNLGTAELTIKNATLKTSANLVNPINLAGEAVFDPTGSIIASGIISGSGSLIKIGEGNLELSGTNAYSGDTILKAGMLTLSNGSNLGTSNLQVQGGKLSLKDGFISKGELTQNTKEAIVIAAGSNNAFSKTTVNSGALVVDGTLTSTVTIGVGGTLRGAGKVVGNTVVEGTLSPGNSPGIFTVKGDLTHKSTTTLEMDIDGPSAGTGAGKHDQVVVEGNFKADGSLVAKLRNITGAATNQFVPSVGQSFEVVKANNVSGVFASYTAPTEGLAAGTRLDVGYTPTSVRLYVTPESYTSVVSGENRTGVSRFLDAALNIERSSAEGLKRLAEGTTDLAKLYQALIPANTQTIQNALMSMSPAIYAESAQSVLALQQTLHNTQTLSESFKKGGVAVKLLQHDTDVDSDGNGLAATRSISGVQLAIDSEPYTNGWQMGATVSVISKGDITGQGAALDLSGQDITLALRKQTKEWLLVGELDTGSYQFDAKRNVVLGATTFANAQDGVKAKTYGLGISATRAITDDWQLLTGLRFNNVNQSAFAESGNSLLRLTVDKVQQNQIIAMVGANWSQSFAAASWKIMPKVGLQLEQTLKGDTAQVDALLSSQRLVSQASDAGKSLFRATVGVSAANQSGLTIGVDATSEQGSNASGTTGRLSLSKSF